MGVKAAIVKGLAFIFKSRATVPFDKESHRGVEIFCLFLPIWSSMFFNVWWIWMNELREGGNGLGLSS